MSRRAQDRVVGFRSGPDLDVPADEYASIERNHWWFVGRRAVVLAAAERFLLHGARVLDVGCGTGGLTAELANRYRVEAVDVSAERVALAVGRGIRARAVAADDPLPHGFDAVGAFDVLEHIDDDLAFARRLTATTRRGGRVLVTVPAYRTLWGPMDDRAGHRRRYRLPGLLSTMRRARLRTLHASYFNTLLFPVLAPLRLAGIPSGPLRSPPPWMNRPLAATFAAEAPLAARRRLPFGMTILYVGRV